MGAERTEADKAARALAALADLTPSAERRSEASTVPLDWFRWLDTGAGLLQTGFIPDPGVAGPTLYERSTNDELALHPTVTLDRHFGEQLAAVQQLRSGANAIRVGWLWVAGTATTTGKEGSAVRRQVFHPLITRHARVYKPSALERWTLAPYGDPEVTPFVTDADTARRFEQVEYGGGGIGRFSELSPTLLARMPKLSAYARGLAAAAGFDTSTLSTDHDQPKTLMQRDALVIVVGLAVYSIEDKGVTPRASGMRSWLDSTGEPTAFHAVYAGSDTSVAAPDDTIEAPFALSPRQREAIAASRTDSVTVISGGPGTGKSHTVTAIVFDALRNDRSVLVTAKSDAAVDALMALLERQPGIEPVMFGSSERRAALAQRLSDGRLRPAGDGDIRRAAESLREAMEARDATHAALATSLEAERLCRDDGRLDYERSRKVVPRLTTARLDLAHVAGLTDLAGRPARGWGERRRRKRAVRELFTAAGAPPGTAVDEVVAAARTVIARLVEPEHSPSELGQALIEHEGAVHRRLAQWLALEIRSDRRLNRAGLGAIGALATALRSGRAARRTQLERMRDRTITRALPVWIGTLGDVDDLLPPVSALFDLVLIDEAASVEQTSAATALLRARRAVIVGDPQQLRHVSFISDATISKVLDGHGIDDAIGRAQLDVRRNSVYDAAAMAAPALMLDEHFRSAPHLIDVVAERLYSGQLHVATRTPVTERLDCVHLVAVTGVREAGGVVRAEIDAVVAELRRLRETARSVGIITPFRAQADALEAALLAGFTTEALVRMNVRVGTAHAFQGNERDHVICSLGLVDGDSGGWAFVNDSNLLAVLLTRARLRMTMVSACTPERGSLLAEYFARADAPPPAPVAPGQNSAWAQQVVGEVCSAGVPLVERYPTGRHVVDAAAVVGHQPVALICGLHQAGIDAHIDRHLALLRGGWKVIDAMQSVWDGRVAELTLDLVTRLHPTTG